MTPTERDKELERLGGLFFSREEALVIVDGGDDPYLRGFLMAEAAVRQGIITLANAGSSPAQVQATKLAQDARIKNA